MAFKIIWSRQAREDLRDIVTFIALDNPTAAEAFGYLLMTKVDALASFPRLGRVVPEENDEDIREIIFRPYRIVYQVIEKQRAVAIARVWHGARGEPEIPERVDF
jgi:toxin ParE1/3/4